MTDIAITAMPAKCNTCEMLQQAPLACADCHQLLAHVQGADYFELFGLPRRFDIDEGDLGRRYLAISRNIHPDKFATAGQEMQTFALRASAAINKAHEVLANPHQRAEYLLERVGGKSAAEDKRVPQDLLSKVMVVREEIEEAKGGNDRAALDAIQGSVSAQKRRLQDRITELCGQLDGGTPSIRDELRMQLNAVKYLDNLLAQL